MWKAGPHRACAFLEAGGWERRIYEAKCHWQTRGLRVLLWAVLFQSPSAGSPAAPACSEEHFAAIQGMRVSQLQPEHENPSRKDQSFCLLYKKPHFSHFLHEVQEESGGGVPRMVLEPKPRTWTPDRSSARLLSEERAFSAFPVCSHLPWPGPPALGSICPWAS